MIGLIGNIIILLIFVPVTIHMIIHSESGLGWLIGCGMFFEVLGIILMCKTGFTWAEVQVDGNGICIVTRKGSVKRCLTWEQIRKYSICSFIQGKENYLCFSANEQLPKYRMCYPGVEWVIFYDSRTIAFPYTEELYLYCEKQFDEHGIQIKPEITGHVSTDTEGVQEFNRRNIRNWWIIFAVVMMTFVLIMAVVWGLTYR